MSVSAEEKIILITGANRGIGLAIIEVAAPRVGSATFILTCRTPSKGTEAVESLRAAGISSKIEVLQLDVMDDASIEAAASKVREEYGRLDVLINNAAQNFFFEKDKPLREVYAETFAMNVTAVISVTNTFLPLLRSSKAPTVINVSSAAGSITRQWGRQSKLGGHATGAYYVSKTALNASTINMMNNELERSEKERIKYYLVCPGFVSTGFNGFMQGGKTPVEGAEVVIKLLEAMDGEGYEAGRFWQFEEGEMRILGW